MADEAGLELSVSVPSSSSPRFGDTSYAGASTSAGSYELHDIPPEKARNVATPETSPDDEHRHSLRSSESPPPTAMSSRPLLLVRSSPAQGTGKLENVCAARLPCIAP